jgi:hypothetical protein
MAKYHYILSHRRTSSPENNWAKNAIEGFGEVTLSKDQYGRWVLNVQEETLGFTASLIIRDQWLGKPSLFEGMLLMATDNRVDIKRLPVPFAYYKARAEAEEHPIEVRGVIM